MNNTYMTSKSFSLIIHNGKTTCKMGAKKVKPGIQFPGSASCVCIYIYRGGFICELCDSHELCEPI